MFPPEPLIPAEAVRAVAVILRAWEVDSSGEGDIAPVEEFDADALELLIAAAPFLAEHIAGLIRERGLEAALDCWCHDTYADLAREAFPKETDR